MASNVLIPIAGPSITAREIDYVSDAVQNAWYGNANMYHERFEKAFADYVGTEFSVALPSCTSAIHLSLAGLGLTRGDEVIVPEVTWIASAAPISYVGATPVFCDIDPQTWCIDPKSVEGCITKNTKAIIAVDLYGGMPDWDGLTALSEKFGIPIIEDSAEAIGSEYHGKKAGGFGIAGVFSFHGSKTLTTGEGGMLLTDDKELWKRILFLRDHGRSPGDLTFRNEEVAFKYKMSSMQAALGLAQLERVEELVEKKRQIFSWYEARLSGQAGLTMNKQPLGLKNSYWMTSVIVSEEINCPKLKLMEILRNEYDIDTRPFFSPLSSIPAYSNALGKRGEVENPVAYSIGRQGINLPSALCLEESDVERSADGLLEVIAKYK